mgnify:CR=1 FL=1
MDNEQLKAILENLLLAADQPVSVNQLQKTLMNGVEKRELQAAIDELDAEDVAAITEELAAPLSGLPATGPTSSD